MDAAHPIFHEPFEVELEFEEVETPTHYRRYYEGRSLPETLKAWRVHGELSQKDYGLVSDGYGFTDSPECEAISGGINSKGPESVALGRQGHWFLWGFCAPPDELTDSARRVFLNTVAYMEQFDGQRPLFEKQSTSRRWALTTASYLADDRLRDYGTSRFDEELLEQCDGDAKQLEQLLVDNLDYVVLDAKRRYRIDADAKTLGFANHDPALLEHCVELLEHDEDAGADDAARARRVLGRYTGETLNGASAWRTWLDARRGRLRFSDCAGYRFYTLPTQR